jgi:hypothetical protein
MAGSRPRTPKQTPKPSVSKPTPKATPKPKTSSTAPKTVQQAKPSSRNFFTVKEDSHILTFVKKNKSTLKGTEMA